MIRTITRQPCSSPVNILALLLVLSFMPTVGLARDVVGDFSNKDLTGWQEKTFAGKTQYRMIKDEAVEDEARWVLEAVSHQSASGLVKEVQIDLRQTPYLNWSWKIGIQPAVDDEQTKAGDDYGARVYVIFKTGPWFWDTRALNYVWNTNYPPGTYWANAFTDKASIMALRSSRDERDRWYHEKRNVKKDIATVFGVDINEIQAIAIMTDSDNSASKATAWYSDIFFSKE